NGDGSFRYTPAADYNGPDGFSYRASDGALNSTATVAITVNAVNDAPVADNDGPYPIVQGGVLNVSAANGVLVGDTDVDSGALTAVLVTGPAHASAFTLNTDGSFNYVHDGSDTGSDSFTYRANDGAAGSNVATVTLT